MKNDWKKKEQNIHFPQAAMASIWLEEPRLSHQEAMAPSGHHLTSFDFTSAINSVY